MTGLKKALFSIALTALIISLGPIRALADTIGLLIDSESYFVNLEYSGDATKYREGETFFGQFFTLGGVYRPLPNLRLAVGAFLGRTFGDEDELEEYQFYAQLKYEYENNFAPDHRQPGPGPAHLFGRHFRRHPQVRPAHGARPGAVRRLEVAQPDGLDQLAGDQHRGEPGEVRRGGRHQGGPGICGVRLPVPLDPPGRAALLGRRAGLRRFQHGPGRDGVSAGAGGDRGPDRPLPLLPRHPGPGFG